VCFANADLDAGELARGTSAFKKFAEETFAGLVGERERAHLPGRRSDLRMFARLDISVIQKESGEREFFVNEVEMGHTVNLFFAQVSHTVGMIAETLVGALHDKVLARRQGYLI
jgi:hypothetical protein